MIMVDLNVILDVVQRRDLHYTASARVLSRVVSGEFAGALPGDAMTTLHDIVARHSGKGGALVRGEIAQGTGFL